MSLINVNLTNNDIEPFVSDYTIDTIKRIDNKLIYCDLSGVILTNYNFTLRLYLTNNENSVQKFNVLFRNNNKNPIINNLLINNISINILTNNNNASTISNITNQEFIITYKESSYTAISTIKKYD